MPVIEDTFNRHVTASGVNVENTVWHYYLFGHYHTGGNTFTRITINIKVLTEYVATVDLDPSPSTQPIYFSIDVGRYNPTDFIAYAEFKLEGMSPWNGTFGFIQFTRATVTGIPFAP